MQPFVIEKACSHRLDEIYHYSVRHWGEAQAKAYLSGLFEHFGKIVNQTAFSQPIPAEFKVSGFYSRYEKHFVYWRYLADGRVGIVTVLHQRMHQNIRLLNDSELF